MRRSFHIVLVSLFSFFLYNSCTVNNVTIDDKIGDIFKSHGVTGTFGMFDNSRGEFTIYDLDRFKLTKSPGQTFHIFTTLVALHTGKLSDDSSMVTISDASAGNLSISSAFRTNSTIHFKELINFIGKDAMKVWIDSVKYGNKKTGNGTGEFWMNDSLLISPDEQLGLIKRLYFKQLPFRESVQEEVKKMMVVENNAQHQLAYQLAEVSRGQKKQAWVLGWIEENRHVYPFVISYDADTTVDTEAVGPALAKDILTHIGFFKGIM